LAPIPSSVSISRNSGFGHGMSFDRQKRVQEILQSALELPPERRDVFLTEACADDPTLRSEVESLLASRNRAEGSSDSPYMALGAEPETELRSDNLLGKRLGPYTVLSVLGRGGMGEVYLAEDGRLKRKVALKLLRPEHTEDADRLKRFERESSVVSALNHPNILTLYEIGEEASHRFMATELVDGETLRQTLTRRKMTISESLEIAIQVSGALSAAHQAGVVHRDIKPENIMLRPDGYIKVLDFGLAKLTERHVSLEESAALETGVGMVMGTFRYMSPEQARGLAVDARTDVFSLGVVLYEMVTGKPPFDGTTPSDLLVALLDRDPPPVATTGDEVSEALQEVVTRALRKKPSDRYASMTEMLESLRKVKLQVDTGVSLSSAALQQQTSALSLPAKVAIGIVMLGLAAAAVYFVANPPSRQAKLIEQNFTQLTTQWGREYHPSISPDGKWVLYVSDASGNEDIYLQAVGGQNPINLTESSQAADREPAFSPDGERIVFRSDREGGGVFVMGRTGESPRLLAENGHNPAWSPDGEEVVFSTRNFVPNLAVMTPGELWTVNATTGERRKLFGGDAAQPHWSPSGERITFCGRKDQTSGWTIQTLPAGAEEDDEALPVTDDGWNPVWSPDGGHIYFISNRGGATNLWRIPIDEATGTALGEPQPLSAPAPYVSHLSISADGRRIAYASRERRTNLQKVRFDAVSGTIQGEPTMLTSGSQEVSAFSVSPEWAAVRYVGQTGITFVRLDGTETRELTTFPSFAPFFSPDGNWVAFHSNRAGHFDIWRIHLDGTGLEQITDGKRDGVAGYVHPLHSPDGSLMSMHSVRMRPGKAFVLDLTKGPTGTPQSLPPLTTGGEFFDPWSWSPDGKRLAGCAIDAIFKNNHYGVVIYSLEEGTYEKVTDFGAAPSWLSDGRRLVFATEGKLYLVDSVSLETQLVYALPPPDRMSMPQLTVDGSHLVYMRSIDESDVWMTELRQGTR
jgi:serine/threonine protein kinase